MLDVSPWIFRLGHKRIELASPIPKSNTDFNPDTNSNSNHINCHAVLFTDRKSHTDFRLVLGDLE